MGVRQLSIPVPAASRPKTVTSATHETLLVPAILVAATVAIVYPDHENWGIPIVVGIVAASLLLLRRSAVWALAPLLLVEFTFNDYVSPQLGISARLATDLIVLALTAPVVLNRLSAGEARSKRVLAPALALVVVATLINLMTVDSDYVFKYFRYQCTLLAALVIAASVIRNRADVVTACALVLVGGVANGVASAWQHLAPDSAPYVAASAAVVAHWEGRSIGLTDSPVTLSATLPFVLVPTIGLVAYGVRRTDRRRLLVLSALILAVGLYVTGTRAAFIAVAAGLIAIALQLDGRRRAVVLASVASAALLFELLAGTGLIQARYYSTDDASAAAHQVLWTADFSIASTNALFGIGNANFQDVSAGLTRDLANNVQGSASQGLSSLGTEQPHNDFLYVWLSWGIAALIVYLLVFIGTLKNFRSATRSRDPLIRGLAIACSGGLIAYAVNSAFHNLLDSTTILWLYAGFSVALASLSARPSSRLRNFLAQRRQLAAMSGRFRGSDGLALPRAAGSDFTSRAHDGGSGSQ